MWVSFIWIKPVGRIGHSMLNWLVIYLLNKLAWILINVPRDVPCQISHCCFYPVAVLRNGQNMALLQTKHGPHMVPKSGFSWFWINVPRDTQCQIINCWVYPVVPFPRNGKRRPFYGQNMVLHIGSSWILINVPRDAPCQIFQILGVSHCPLFLEMAKIWPFYCQNIVLTWSFKLVLPKS